MIVFWLPFGAPFDLDFRSQRPPAGSSPANLKNLAVLALSAFSVHPSWPAIWGELNPRVDGNPKTIETLTQSRTPSFDDDMNSSTSSSTLRYSSADARYAFGSIVERFEVVYRVMFVACCKRVGDIAKFGTETVIARLFPRGAKESRTADFSFTACGRCSQSFCGSLFGGSWRGRCRAYF